MDNNGHKMDKSIQGATYGPQFRTVAAPQTEYLLLQPCFSFSGSDMYLVPGEAVQVKKVTGAEFDKEETEEESNKQEQVRCLTSDSNLRNSFLILHLILKLFFTLPLNWMKSAQL